jgi:hypothetical protein
MSGASRRWPVAPKVHAAAGSAGAGALLLQLVLTILHADGGQVLSVVLHALAPLMLAYVGGWRAPHQDRPPPAPQTGGDPA